METTTPTIPSAIPTPADAGAKEKVEDNLVKYRDPNFTKSLTEGFHKAKQAAIDENQMPKSEDSEQ
ncbi:MAG: hypothetical protein QF437_09040 [Planctomycetota bacterium]|jgi:hypothetical protein|nr:hypothetical protein [Planctomycetota bacterium]MDP7130621.1 hypothetical protein [Planctomycetota bacterium]